MSVTPAKMDNSEHIKPKEDVGVDENAPSSNPAMKALKSVATDEETSAKKPTTGDEEDSKPRSKLNIVLLMISLCTAVFLAALDQIIVATALPAISESIGASATSYAWIASAYLLANASSIPLWGRVSDIFGRKQAILAANLIFMIGSLVAALAHSLTALIVGRAVQGSGGGGLLVLANICISDIFSLRERGFYLSIIGGTWAIASSIGPIVGGAFSEYVTWRWCFWVNLPCDAVSAIGLFFFLKIHNPRTPFWEGIKAIDWLGALASTGATIMFLLGLDFGGTTYAWNSATVICLIVFGIVTYFVFALIEWKLAKFPLIPLRIFNNRSMFAIFGVCFFHAAAFISAVYYLPLYFQAVLGATPLLSGVWILALAVPLSAASVITGVFLLKTGRYVALIAVGMALLTLGLGLFINFQAYRSWSRIIIFQIIASIGMALVFQAPIVALQTRLAPKDIGVGTAAFQFLRQASCSVGVVLGQVLLESQIQKKAGSLVDANVPQTLIMAMKEGSLVTVAKGIPLLSNDEQKEVVRSVLNDGLSTMWILFTCMAFAGLLCSFGIVQEQLTTRHREFKTGLKSQKE